MTANQHARYSYLAIYNGTFNKDPLKRGQLQLL